MDAAPSRSFERFGGVAAILAGIAGLLYAVAFVVVSRAAPEAARFLAPLLLVAGALVAVPAITALYRRVGQVDPGLALVALLFAVAGAIGSAVHGALDLANAFHPPGVLPEDIPNPVDPRGFLTFGVAGVGTLFFSVLIARGAGLPPGLATLGYVSGALLVLIYLARLIVLEPTSPLILAPAALEGFVVNPAWYVWLGLALRRGSGDVAGEHDPREQPAF